jgi:hypothetical protein
MHPDDDRDSDSNSSLYSDVSSVTTATGRIPYSESEDVGIIHFLVQSDQLQYLKGNKIWREAADQKTDPPQRTWQSLKNRFFQNILPHVRKDQYRLLSEEHRNLILSCCAGDDDEDGDRESDTQQSGDSHVPSGTSDNPYLSFLRDMEKKQRSSRRRVRSHSPAESSSSTSAADADPDPDVTVINQNADAPNRRNFTDDEDKAIISYILKRIAWSRKTGDVIQLRGMLFWTTMHKVTGNCRTAHSLRERFLKRILPNLKKYLHIEPVDAEAIRKHAQSSSKSH